MRIGIPSLLLPVAFCGFSYAQMSPVQIQGTTATQAVLSYTSPDTRACRVEVSESPRYLPVIADVDPRLFTRADFDLDRKGTVVSQRSRLVVIGRRIAETATDGKRYSRALQAYTRHYVRVTCSGLVQETSFDTTNIALGQTYNDPLPGDPAKPGEYAWPTVDWADRTQRVIDPMTGLQIRHLTMSDDMTSKGRVMNFTRARDLAGVWNNAGAAAGDDKESASTFDTGWLFLESGWNMTYGGTRDYNLYAIRSLPVTLNAWCEGCGNVSTLGRTIEACLSIDGIACAGKTLETVLESCTGDCTGSRYRITLGAGGPPIITPWGLDKVDQTDYHMRTGNVSRRGSKVTWTGGSKFNVNWKRGSQIDVNGRTFSIRKMNSELQLTLEGEFSDDDVESGPYSSSNFGLLVRRKIVGAGRIAVQHAQFTFEQGDSARWEGGGELETYTSCAPKMVAGPGGEMGWHCSAGSSTFWIGGESGIANRLGLTFLPGRQGVDGWGGSGFCDSAVGGGPLWDADDPDAFYCGQASRSPEAGTAIIRVKYFGSNGDSGPSETIQLRECNGSRNNQPCFELTNMTPVSRSMTISQQLKRMFPAEYELVRNATVNITSARGRYLQFAQQYGNNLLAIVGLMEPSSGRVVAAAPTWNTWPMRWTGLHGIDPMMDDTWMSIPATFFRGPSLERENQLGNGPYMSRVTSGEISGGGGACPARPSNSPIPAVEWPTEARCVEVTIDGEPGDPTPWYFDEGTVSSNGNVITGTGLFWGRPVDGAQIVIDGRWYKMTLLTDSSARIAPDPPVPFRNAKYVIYGDPVNNPKTGNPMHAYLQDMEVRDIVAVTKVPYISLYPWVNEFARVLVKQGNRVVLERGLIGFDGKRSQMLASPAGSFLVMMPSGCNFGRDYFCPAPQVIWNTVADPTGKNLTGTTVTTDFTAQGGGHTTYGPLATINAGADSCPNNDGLGYSCYNIRPGSTFPQRALAENFRLSNNPPFQGRAGVGEPNAVESHPTYKQRAGIASDEDLTWFLDARPFLGAYVTGSEDRPGIEVEEGLWKFTRDQIARLRPKYMPVVATCGTSPLRDISGPLSRIVGTSEDSMANAYTYCIANRNGECREDSAIGDAYVSCPFISTPRCAYPGVAAAGGDTRDICLMDNGAYNQGITQLKFTEPDLTGRDGRILTYGLSQYRYNDAYWNARTTPDGKWLMFRNIWVNNVRSDAFLAKIPPFQRIDDQARNGYLFTDLQVTPDEVPGQAGAMVEFGYNDAFECTSRKESCVAGEAGPGEPFYYIQSEGWRITPCKGGCTVRIPVIPQRVVYFRIRYFDEDGREIQVGGTNVWAIP